MLILNVIDNGLACDYGIFRVLIMAYQRFCKKKKSLKMGCTTYSTANIKAVRGSLWWLSVNKLSHIPEFQSVSAVYENQ